MQPIGVFGRVHREQRRGGVIALGHRQLHDVRMHRRVAIELGHRVHQRMLPVVGGQPDVERVDAHLLAGLVLLADIARTRSVLTYEDSSEPRRDALAGQCGDTRAHIGQHGVGHRPTGQELCGHRDLLAARDGVLDGWFERFISDGSDVRR